MSPHLTFEWSWSSFKGIQRGEREKYKHIHHDIFVSDIMMQNDSNIYITSFSLFRTWLSLFSLGVKLKYLGALFSMPSSKKLLTLFLIDLLKLISIKICLTEVFFVVAWYQIWHIKGSKVGSFVFLLRSTLSISFIPCTFTTSGGPGFTRIEKWAVNFQRLTYNLTIVSNSKHPNLGWND